MALPQELLDYIVQYLSGEDIACLALTCKYFFYNLGLLLQRLLLQDNAPWAGDRLICLGGSGHGAPDGALTDAERRRFEDGRAGSPSLRKTRSDFQ